MCNADVLLVALSVAHKHPIQKKGPRFTALGGHHPIENTLYVRTPTLYESTALTAELRARLSLI